MCYPRKSYQNIKIKDIDRGENLWSSVNFFIEIETSRETSISFQSLGRNMTWSSWSCCYPYVGRSDTGEFIARSVSTLCPGHFSQELRNQLGINEGHLLNEGVDLCFVKSHQKTQRRDGVAWAAPYAGDHPNQQSAILFLDVLFVFLSIWWWLKV